MIYFSANVNLFDNIKQIKMSFCLIILYFSIQNVFFRDINRILAKPFVFRNF
jgi:hypothetical protein